MSKGEQIVQLFIDELYNDLVMDMVAEQTYTRKELLPKLDNLETKLEELLND